MELSAGGVEGLLLLPRKAGPDEWSAFVVDEMEKDILDGYAPQIGVFVTASDDLAAEHPEMVAVAVQGFCCQALLEQMAQEGPDAFEDALAEGDVGVLAAPAPWPVAQIWAHFGQRRNGWCMRHADFHLCDSGMLAEHDIDPGEVTKILNLNLEIRILIPCVRAYSCRSYSNASCRA